MLWFLLALTGAFCQAVYGLAVKVFQQNIPPFMLAGFSFLAGSAILFCISSVFGIPVLGPGLAGAITVTVIINLIATILFYHALSVTDLSLSIPMLAFTPVFLILTSLAILGEIPSPAGAAGIILVATGAWLLSIEYREGRPVSLTGPLGILRSERGVQAMLLVAFLYSISVNYDKEVVGNSDPVFGSAIVFLLLGLAFLVLSRIFRVREKTVSRDPGSPLPEDLSGPDLSLYLAALPEAGEPLSPRGLPVRDLTRDLPGLIIYLAIGVLLTAEVIAINTAYTMAIVPYVITVKRLSIFFSVLFGGLLFAEPQFRGRVLGAMVMIAGTAVIGLWG
jgi:drug/metabolite transporter (DMT)-like permease